MKINIHDLFVPQDRNNVGAIYTRKTEEGVMAVGTKKS
jgi:hypothetical protein